MSEGKPVVIRSIDKKVVNQICSGQVILSLATAVKELVENSIDACATSIQVRLKEYGSEMIEIIDNGCGVEEKNFQALTLKHYTSKIADFADVANVETFGFRGEALSSLCSLSKVSIITKHKDSLYGTKLKFDNNGIITESCKIARQIGTTVTLENIFYTLPVRHKEFLRNIKKEFTKMCNVLYAYGLLSKGVSFVCSNQVSNKKLTIMETKGETLKSNIIQIFGVKQCQNLLEIITCTPDDIQAEYGKEENINMKVKFETDFQLEGFVSSCAHGCGRSSTDRQFYYINSRPVDNAKVSKVVNDVYHQYNPHQYPFIVLNIKISMSDIDVNVTPDKRLIFMKNEKLLLSIIQTSLNKLFQNIPAVLELQNIGVISNNMETHQLQIKEETTIASPLEKLKKFYSSNCTRNEDKNDVKACQKKSKGAVSMRSVSLKSLFKSTEPTNVQNETENINPSLTSDNSPNLESGRVVNFSDELVQNIDLSSNVIELQLKPITEKTETEEKRSSVSLGEIHRESAAENKRKAIVIAEDNNSQIQKEETLLEETKTDTIKRLKIDSGMTEDFKKSRKSTIVNFSMNKIKKQSEHVASKIFKKGHFSNDQVKFYSRINPSQNESAEKELKRELHKESFKQMEIIGQFNLGFIITKLGADIFIIDQHATDEKYNFETLQKNTKIQTQKLVIPQNLNLTIEKEELLLHHSDIIRQNGFDFLFDNTQSPTNRVKLISVPLSKNWIFGKEDIDEMLFILENAPDGNVCRPSRVRDMFASRACRKSVMIGTPLNYFEMRRLVDHMGEIEQPWNCPHGRPTISFALMESELSLTKLERTKIGQLRFEYIWNSSMPLKISPRNYDKPHL